MHESSFINLFAQHTRKTREYINLDQPLSSEHSHHQLFDSFLHLDLCLKNLSSHFIWVFL